MVVLRSRVLMQRSTLIAPALAASLAAVAVITGAKGVDLAAATYRVEMFARDGLTLWDSQWYGGHWTFDYSVLFAPIGWLTGIAAMEIACVAVSAWAFDRLAVAHFGTAGRVGAVVFAVGTVVQVAIGQAPYLLGATLGLGALLAAARCNIFLGVVLAAACALASPLSGGFLGMIAIAWLIASWPRRRRDAAGLAVASLAPVLALQALFPAAGTMPFPLTNLTGMLAGITAIGVLGWRRERTITVCVVVYAAALVFAYVVPSQIGNNMTRLGTTSGLGLAAMLIWDAPRRARMLLAAAAVPLALAQWVPATRPLLGEIDPSSLRVAYFKPLLGYLHRHDRPLARVEVVPTADHWEAAYVAPYFPLARGWERQLDRGDNAIFYRPGALTPSSYLAWLIENGVRYVALPDVALDYAAKAEARLLRAGVRGLRLAWHDSHWRVYVVAGAPGLVSGPARLLAYDGAEVTVRALRAGDVIVRERYVAAWRVVAGDASVRRGPAGWISVQARRAGPIALRIVL